MAKKNEVGVVYLPHGHIGAFFNKNCLFNLHALNPEMMRHEEIDPEPAKWPGYIAPEPTPSKQK